MNTKPAKAYQNSDFLNSHTARPLRILSEYLEPEFRFRQTGVHHTMVFFGSARLREESPYYQSAEEFAFRCALMAKELRTEFRQSIHICTGGGPGIMEAANRGAHRAGEKNIGLNISLPYEQIPNSYISPELNFEFHYFFTRKLWFLYHARVLIAFPGGFGTLDELFEALTLSQTEKLGKQGIPILLYSTKFWKDLINFDKLVNEGLITHEDLSLFRFFDSPDEGIEILRPALREAMEHHTKRDLGGY